MIVIGHLDVASPIRICGSRATLLDAGRSGRPKLTLTENSVLWIVPLAQHCDIVLN